MTGQRDKLINFEEFQQREKERRSKSRHAGIVLEKQVNKEVDEGYKHLKVKLKALEQASPEAQLLLNLKKQSKESRKQRILEEIKKAPGEGSGSAPESPAHIDSSDNSVWNSTDDDKTESDKDSEHGDESVDSENDVSDKDFDDDEDQAADFMIRPHNKELVQPQKEPQIHSRYYFS
ncbi:hypothetical protein Tco_0011529 [Tanacetum coccineum]